MSHTAASNFLRVQDAQSIVVAGLDAIQAIIKLAANGLKSDGILEFARAAAEGRAPTATLAVGTPRPLRILAHSFLQDPHQYADLYDISEDEIRRLRSEYKSAPEACMQEITARISAKLSRSGSTRPVIVTSDGDPGTSPANASPLAGSSAVTKTYAAEIRSNSGVYGSYKFVAFDTGLEVTQAYGVDLGKEVFALAPSKKLAVCVARIASLKGRQDPMVSPYIVYVSSSGRCVAGGDIPDTVWSCIKSPREPVAVSSRKPGSVEPTAAPRVPTPQGHGSRGKSVGSASVVG